MPSGPAERVQSRVTDFPDNQEKAPRLASVAFLLAVLIRQRAN